MNARHLECLIGAERRKQPGQAFSQHGLARPRGADEQQMMATGGSYLDGQAAERLPYDVGHVGDRLHASLVPQGWADRPSPLASQDGYQHLQIVHASHVGASDQLGLGRGGRWHDDRSGGQGVDERQNPGDLAQAPIEPQFAQKSHAGYGAVRNLAVGDQKRHGDR
jgi:hypothetical protein